MSAALRVLLALILAVGLMPPVAWADTTSSQSEGQPSYGWYSSDPGASTFTLSSPDDFLGFADIVNGEADLDGDGQADASFDFSGKTVQLGSSLNFQYQVIEPVGREATPFQGAFDGCGFTVDNFTIEGSANRCSDLGLFGYAGPEATLGNVVIGEHALLTVSLGDADDPEADNQAAAVNLGLLAGYCAGSISGVVTSGTVQVSHHMNQTKDNVFPIRNVGGIAGLCLGSMTGCTATSKALVFAEETGTPYKATVQETDWDDQSVLVMCVGGIVGCFGAPDTSVVKFVEGQEAAEAASTQHGTLSSCSNSSTVRVATPKTNGLDRFNNVIYSMSSDVGGIAGYSRGSVDSCSNYGYISGTYERVAEVADAGAHAKSVAGIVGNLRSLTESTSYNANFSSDGSDDGMIAQEGDALVVSDCVNEGTIYGYAFPADIVGRAGTYTTVTGCLNGTRDEDASVWAGTVIATRPTKPFPAGIVGSSSGVVSYCGNYGSIYSGDWTGVDFSTVAQKSGYYTAGLVGNTVYFTKKNSDGDIERATPMPEVYGCFSGGTVNAVDNMRQRLLVGDNGGYVHNCIGLKGLCWEDRLVYGMYEGDTETSGGSWSNIYAVSESDMRKNAEVLTDDETPVSTGYTVLGMLNAQATSDDFARSWLQKEGFFDGYPVLNTLIDWDASDISNAQVSLKQNAAYDGTAAIPRATVELDGVTLVQDVDFRVVVDPSAVEISAEPCYTASIQGIGNYSGTANQLLSYGIDKGNLASCTVSIDTATFNWKSQLPTFDTIHVKNAAGVEVDSSHFEFALDPENDNLTDGEAVNVGKYRIILTAKESSELFEGSTSGTFSIKTAKIQYTEGNAQVSSIEYLGETIPWDSSAKAATESEHEFWTTSYTGRSIKPSVTSVVYLGKNLELGRDYRVVYGGGELMEGATVEAGTENVGVAGGTADGFITVRYIPGGNFSNYDIMKFVISDEEGYHQETFDMAKATVGNDGDIIFEEGDPYEPITVWYGGSQLKEGVDYAIAYEGNDAVGTASYTITGLGSEETGGFVGTKTGTFRIVAGQPYNLAFEVDDEAGTAAVSGVEYLGARDLFDLVIPESVEQDGVEYPVTAIADKAFGGASPAEFTGSVSNVSKGMIRSVIIPASVETIGAYAFSTVSATEWGNLKTVIFDDIENSSLTTISKYAFRGCGKMTEFTFPAQVDSIGAGAFQTGSTTAASKLTKLVFLTEDAQKPSDVSKTLTFSGLGSNGTKVKVWGHDSAAMVQQLAANNGISSAGTNAGRNFSFVSIEQGEIPDPVEQAAAKLSSVTKIYSYTSLSKAAAKFTLAASGVKGGAKVTFAKTSGSSKISVSSSGAVTVAKGIAKGTYKVGVKASVAAVDGYLPKTMTATITVKVLASQSSAKISASNKKYTYASLKKAAKSFKVKTTGLKDSPKVTYSKVSGKSAFKVSSSGKVTIAKKGLKKGTYKLKVKASVQATSKYSAKTLTKTITVKVV